MHSVVEGTRRRRWSIVLADPSENFARHKPDAHFQIHGDGGISGHYSLWWKAMPNCPTDRVGMIGHYAASGNVGSLLLTHACRELAEHGCTMAVGPIDGSTWRTYRFITQSSGVPRFFLEPDHPPEWVDHFTGGGFEPLARYFSALNDDLTKTDPRIERVASRLTAAGVTLRPIRGDAQLFEEDLRQIFSVALVAFRDNLLYSDPDEVEFIETYRTLLGKVPLDLILLAEQAGRAIGFVFAVPDLLESARGEPVRTVIAKTLAALPLPRYAGLGQWLLAELQHRAHAIGFTRAIHALVRDHAHLCRISARYARTIREYTLFARMLCR